MIRIVVGALGSVPTNLKKSPWNSLHEPKKEPLEQFHEPEKEPLEQSRETEKETR